MKEFYKNNGKRLRKAYHAQRQYATLRNIPWEFSFYDWAELWYNSGKWEQRGRGYQQYCMARYNDTGPYAKDNVAIITTRENNLEMLILADELMEF